MSSKEPPFVPNSWSRQKHDVTAFIYFEHMVHQNVHWFAEIF